MNFIQFIFTRHFWSQFAIALVLSGVLIFLSDEMRNKESQKDYGIGAQILNCLNIKKIKLMSEP